MKYDQRTNSLAILLYVFSVSFFHQLFLLIQEQRYSLCLLVLSEMYGIRLSFVKRAFSFLKWNIHSSKFYLFES